MYPAITRQCEKGTARNAVKEAPADSAGGRKVLEFVRDSRLYT
jgi:hypothetical protein